MYICCHKDIVTVTLLFDKLRTQIHCIPLFLPITQSASYAVVICHQKQNHWITLYNFCLKHTVAAV